MMAGWVKRNFDRIIPRRRFILPIIPIFLHSDHEVQRHHEQYHENFTIENKTLLEE